MDYTHDGVYYESDISRSMSNQTTNHNQSMTNYITCNLVELIELVGIIGTQEPIRMISHN